MTYKEESIALNDAATLLTVVAVVQVIRWFTIKALVSSVEWVVSRSLLSAIISSLGACVWVLV
jgi:hypothetical protein